MSFGVEMKLPTTFLGLPLYIGIELILGIAVLNKLSGLYGILSIFTGHPLDFSQWLLYISSIVIVPFYFRGLYDIKNPEVLPFAGILLIYTVDSATTLFFIIHFMINWFVIEDVKTVEVPGQDYSKSASQGYEYGWILVSSAAIFVTRIYFNFVIWAFYKKLVKMFKVKGIPIYDDDVQLDLKNQSFLRRGLYKFDKLCFNLLEKYDNL